MSSFYTNERVAITCPVTCDYCATVELDGRTNCKSCGGPLPIPEVREEIVETRVYLNREILDVTTHASNAQEFIVGIMRAHADMKTHRVQRLK